MKTAQFVRTLSVGDGWRSDATVHLYKLSEPHSYTPPPFEAKPARGPGHIVPQGTKQPVLTHYLAVSSHPFNRITSQPETIVICTDETGRPPSIHRMAIQAKRPYEMAFADVLNDLGYAQVFLDLATGPDTQVTIPLSVQTQSPDTPCQ
ncbi:hypothetical protein [Fibrella aestuarina]|nr:hypothetical protein [Fibrella aestuarina]